jgi:hypothetical protein
MLGQQLLLRVPLVKRAFKFPEGWPFKRTIALQPQSEGMKAVAPFFERLSQIAAGNFRSPPRQRYISSFGLRDPGVPLPPPLPEVAKAVPVVAAAVAPAAAAAAAALPPRPATELLLSQRPAKR